MQLETAELLSILLIGIIIGIYNFRSSKLPFRLLLLLLLLTFIAESLAEYFAHRYGDNLIVYHLFNPIEYAMFASVFYFLIENRKLKFLIPLSIVVFVPLSIINSFFWERFSEDKINTHSILAESILLVILSLQVLLEFLKKPFYLNIYRAPSFWLSVGALLFFATNIFFWGYYNRFVSNENGVHIFYKILFYENIALYSLCALSLWLARCPLEKKDIINSY